jgi:hypothetical protein
VQILFGIVAGELLTQWIELRRDRDGYAPASPRNDPVGAAIGLVGMQDVNAGAQIPTADRLDLPLLRQRAREFAARTTPGGTVRWNGEIRRYPYSAFPDVAEITTVAVFYVKGRNGRFTVRSVDPALPNFTAFDFNRFIDPDVSDADALQLLENAYRDPQHDPVTL